MNLCNEPWIPVVAATGRREIVTLRQVFCPTENVQDLAVRPHERVAMMRLLLCIAQRALAIGVSSMEEYDSRVNTAIRDPDMLYSFTSSYLNDFSDCFTLDHPNKPFLQFANLSKRSKNRKNAEEDNDDEETGNAISKLDFALATGNNNTLFDHAAATSDARVFDPALAALMLITFQSFSPGGRIGVAQWHGRDTPGAGASAHAPCSPSSMLHSFIRRDSLRSSITANLLTASTIQDAYGAMLLGKPVWELMPSSFADQAAITNATQTFLGKLMPLSRSILLNQDGSSMILANGLEYAYNPATPEPSASNVIKSDGTGYALVGAGNRAIWRELPALLIKTRSQSGGGPLALANMSPDEEFQLWVGALQTDKASVLDTVESVFSIKPSLFPGLPLYADEVKYANATVSYSLSEATKKYRQMLEIKPQNYPEKEAAQRHYWTSVELLLPLLFSYVEADGAVNRPELLQTWRRSLWQSARKAFVSSCANETPRQQRAYAIALNGIKPFKTKNNKTKQTLQSS